MSGGCWNYMNDSAASEILGYHIYVGYGLDSDRHEKNYRQVIRDNPLGDPEISALVYDVFCLLTGVVLGLIANRGIFGDLVGVGTILGAFGTGVVMKFIINRLGGPLGKWFGPLKKEQAA